ncbi:beta-1,3-galactosyltransferase 5-like [Sitodiplosis mosellana]|uniref:beta-1,3-galactosyltransferase 5-like n=1 Tax=Sitodiplosis mosellana TaxID=263140 RepID=UPI002444952E|nr:beta-1,3-galactosyltransferase 5-like [Sitodiplosis mosellana]
MALATVVLIGNIVFLLRYLMNARLDEREFLNPQLFDDIKNDGGILADRNQFKYLIANTECRFESSNDPHPNFIIAVNSNPRAKEMRQTIRDSWGSYEKSAKTIFFLGVVDSEQIQEEIEAEYAEFGDIVQGNFIDHQRNLTIKHLMILNWSVVNCLNAKYLIKIDDNVFANVPAIGDFLAQNPLTKNFLMGTYHEPELCPREGDSKVTHEEYASDYYPAYAEGHSIIYSMDVAVMLCYKSNFVEFFWVEDVFITGILRSQINVDIEPSEKYILTRESLIDMRQTTLNLPTPMNFMFSLPNLIISDQIMLWDRTEWYRLGETNSV